MNIHRPAECRSLTTRTRGDEPGYGHCMAVTGSREILIEASPGEILDVVADIGRTPEWSPQHQSAQVLESFDNGRPRLVRAKVKTAGISDVQTVEYTWSDDFVSWTLVEAGQLKAQTGRYTLTAEGDATRVRVDVSVELAIPLPGFIVKTAMKGALDTATNGLRGQVLKVTKG